MPNNTIYLSLGSNLGDRKGNLARALECLRTRDFHITAQSSFYETEPRDYLDQPWFLNAVIACETAMSPPEAIAATRQVECELGRDQTQAAIPKGPRLIDIDILLFDGSVIDEPELQVPHPRMLGRRFVLEPLVQIAPWLRHPVSGKLLAQYLEAVQDQKISLH